MHSGLKMTITAEQIHAAADELNAAGKKITLEAVRNHLGGGSFATISPAIRSWKDRKQLDQTIVTSEPMPAALEQRLEGLASGIWAMAVELAQKRFEDDRSRLRDNLDELSSSRDEAIELADRLSTDLERAQAGLIMATQEKQEMVNELAGLKETLAETRERAASAQARTEELRAELSRSHEELRSLRTEAKSSLVDATTLRGDLERAQEEMRTLREQLQGLEKSPGR